MSDLSSDVVVLGCGPTGLVVASLLRRSGYGVLCLECDDTSCAGALVVTPPALDVMDDLGWLRELSKLPCGARCDGLELRGHGESVVLEEDWHALVLPAEHGSVLMEEAARDLGVEFLSGRAVVLPVWRDRRVVGVRVRDSEGGQATIDAKVVIDASGPRAFMASALGHMLPRRGPRRSRVSATLGRACGDRSALFLRAGSWLHLHPSRPPAAAAVVRTGKHDERDALELTDSWLRAENAELETPEVVVRMVADRVGSHLRARAGEGWVAVGEAAGCGAPGSPGTLGTELVQAACAAWEIDLGLSRGRALGPGQLGATVALSRRVNQLESILDRALARAAATERLGVATATPRRRRLLGTMLEGDWGTSTGWLSRMTYLWWLDWLTRAARSRAGERPWRESRADGISRD